MGFPIFNVFSGRVLWCNHRLSSETRRASHSEHAGPRRGEPPGPECTAASVVGGARGPSAQSLAPAQAPRLPRPLCGPAAEESEVCALRMGPRAARSPADIPIRWGGRGPLCQPSPSARGDVRTARHQGPTERGSPLNNRPHLGLCVTREMRDRLPCGGDVGVPGRGHGMEGLPPCRRPTGVVARPRFSHL